MLVQNGDESHGIESVTKSSKKQTKGKKCQLGQHFFFSPKLKNMSQIGSFSEGSG